MSANIWRAEGVSVVPAQPKSKAVRLPWRDYEENPPDRSTIEKWFSNGLMNLAVICGTGRLLVLDFDETDSFEQWRERAGNLAETYTEATQRGVHLFYRVEKPVTQRFSECEALGLGHLCMVSPSIHPTGALYHSPDASAPILDVKTDELFSLLSALPTRVGQSPRVETGPVTNDRVDLVGQIKATLPIVRYAQSLTEMKSSGREGRWFLGLCPFHEDTEPSFWVDAQRGTWGCYKPGCPGARGGDVINLYALSKGIEIREAIRQLAGELLA